MTPSDNLAAIRLSMEMYLTRLLPYLEQHMDTQDTDNGRPHGNEAMALHTLGTGLLRSIESKAAPLPLGHAFVPCPWPLSCECQRWLPKGSCHQIVWRGESLDIQQVCGAQEAAHIPRAAEPEPHDPHLERHRFSAWATRPDMDDCKHCRRTRAEHAPQPPTPAEYEAHMRQIAESDGPGDCIHCGGYSGAHHPNCTPDAHSTSQEKER